MRLFALLPVVGMGFLACQPTVVAHLDPPPAGEGFQLRVPEFEVPQGAEIQGCYFYEVPGNPGDEWYIDRYEMAQADGSHHMNIFRVKTIRNLIAAPGESVVSMNGVGPCFDSANWADWPMVANTQDKSITDWKLPPDVGARFAAGELLMLQTHWVNATTQKTPEKAAVSANFWRAVKPPTQELGTLFATNQNISICPGDVDRFFTKTCKFPSQGVNVIAANGHFHSRGRRFEMFPVDPQGAVGERFYDSTSWDDPDMKRDFSVPLPPNGGVQWKCTFAFPEGACGDPSKNCCYSFGGVVETQEHCNAFVYYYPKTVDVNCF
jgi:hypothetical protein